MSSGGGSEERRPASDLRSEFEGFKSEVNRVVSELKKEIEDLKNSIIDLRASLSEVENPFNLLAALAGEEGARRLTDLIRREGKIEGKEERVERRELEKGLKAAEKPPPQQLSREVPEVGFNTSIALIKWVWTLLDLGFDEEDVKKLSSYCEFFGLLPRGSSRFISGVASAVNKARSLNLSEEMVALSIYGAAKASGVKIELEDITDIVFNALRKFIARPELPPFRGGGEREL